MEKRRPLIAERSRAADRANIYRNYTAGERNGNPAEIGDEKSFVERRRIEYMREMRERRSKW